MTARRTRVLVGALVAVSLARGGAAALGQPAAAAPHPDLRASIETWTLSNGLTVARVERQRAPMVTVQVWYRFGSKDEPAGQRGAARVLERLMFEGSERVRPGDHRALIEAVGGQA